MFKNKKSKKDGKKTKKHEEPSTKSKSESAGEQAEPAPEQQEEDQAEIEEQQREAEREQRKREERKRKEAEREARKRAEHEQKKRQKDETKRNQEEEDRKSRRKKEKTDTLRNIVEDVDENIEIQELENAKGDAGEPEDIFKQIYNLFPSSVYTAYNKLQGFSRELDTPIGHPEVVLIGPAGSSKSALLEALLGYQFSVHGPQHTLKRPLYVKLVNNLSCAEPKCTLKRDNELSGNEFDRDREVALEALPAEILKRNAKYSNKPVYVQWESNNVMNMTFIDCPGIPDTADGAFCRELVESLASPPNRMLLVVERSQPWEQLVMPKIVKALDPNLSRSVFIYTSFHTALLALQSLEEVNRYLSGQLPDAKTFFVSLPSWKVRAKFAAPDKYQLKLWQSFKRDMNNLESLQYDKRFERNVGLHALRKQIFTDIWKKYQNTVPQILKTLRQKKTSGKTSLVDLKKQAAELDPYRFRSIANSYVTSYLQVLQKLVYGTAEGNPSVLGQTLKDERSSLSNFEWTDANGKSLSFEANSETVPFFDCKVYGGQQFERLLSEFKAVCDQTSLPKLSKGDVQTASGVSQLNNVPKYAWAASDLAQMHSKKQFTPLIEQLTQRAAHIAKNLGTIADKVLEARKSSGSETSIDNADNYPHFKTYVQDLFSTFITNVATKCVEKCSDEFYGTETILWEHTEFLEKKLPTDRATDRSKGGDEDETRSAVTKLAQELFKTIKERLTKNVMLKLYNYFIVPIQSDLWDNIHGLVSTLPEDKLNEFFQVEITKKKLTAAAGKLEGVVAKFEEQEKQILADASEFSHPAH